MNAVLNFDAENTHYMSLAATLMTPTLALNLNSLYFGANV